MVLGFRLRAFLYTSLGVEVGQVSILPAPAGPPKNT